MEIIDKLALRVKALDSVAFSSVDEALIGFIAILEDLTRDLRGHDDALEAGIADSISSDSRFIAEMRNLCPSFVVGGRAIPPQLWTRFPRPWWVEATNSTLEEGHFRSFEDPAIGVCTKPMKNGLFTSSDYGDGLSMWQLYAAFGPDSSALEGPGRTWKVVPKISARILNISSAQDWARLVLAAPLLQGGRAYPDWTAISKSYDGIRMLLPAIVATQDVCIVFDGLRIAPPHWSVESTLWLRWCFENIESV